MDVRVGSERRLSAKELMLCWRRLLRVPWTERRSNQSIPKEINPDHSLEGQMLKLQNCSHLTSRVSSLQKILMLGKTEGERRGQQKMRWLNSITDSMDMLLLLLLSRFSRGWLCATPQTVAHQAPRPWDSQEFKQTPGDSEGQRSLVCCSPWGRKKLDMTYWLNNNNNGNVKKIWEWSRPVFAELNDGYREILTGCHTQGRLRNTACSRPYWDLTPGTHRL